METTMIAGKAMDSPHLALGPVGNVFLFAEDFEDAVTWYTGLLGREPLRGMPQLAVWDLGEVRLTLHKEDEFNSQASGSAGTVAYFTVGAPGSPDAVDEAAAICVHHGGVVHRGPKTVFSGERLVQISDPFGNLIGLRNL